MQQDVQKNEEKIAAAAAVEPQTPDSVQKDDLKQKDVDQLLTFDQSKPPKQPAGASEEAETLMETESIAAGGK